MLSPGSTYLELGGQDNDPSSWRALVGGHQLERRGTPHLHQHGPFADCCTRHGYHGRLMTSCMLMDPLGAEVVRRPGLLSGWHGTYVLDMFSR
jgi:hypothetical protein